MSENTYVDSVKTGKEEGRVSADDLSGLKSELKAITKDVKSGLFQRRYWCDRTRFCVWPGQSPDGRKRSAVMGKEAFPFDGASDARIRMADEIINERVSIQMAAILRAHPKVTGMEISDSNAAGKIRTLLRWILFNQIGRNFLTELERVLNFQEGDAPGIGIMGVYWEQESGLLPEEISMDQLREYLMLFVQQGADPEEMQSLFDAVLDKTREDEAAALLMALIPNLDEDRAARAVKDLRDKGAARMPVPYQKKNMLKLCAHRVLDDIFFPSETSDIQRARVILRREWLTKAELSDRMNSMGWKMSFVEKVTGKIPNYSDQAGVSSVEEVYREIDNSERVYEMAGERKDYEIWTAYSKAVNDAGEVGITVTTFHPNVDEAAKDRELLNYDHGLYPFVDFTREHVTARLMDSRGIPELVQTDQDTVKMLHDGSNDNAQVGLLPPYFKPNRLRGVKLEISPLVGITRMRKDEFEWFPAPPRPMESHWQVDMVELRQNRYFGRPAEGISDVLVSLHRNQMISRCLAAVSDVMKMGVSLALQYMDDEQVQRVVGGNGLPVARTVDELQGQYDIFLHFDANDLNPEYVNNLIKTMGELLRYDTENTVRRNVVVRQIMEMINPQLADMAVVPREDAMQKEIDDEQKNFALIFAGVEPPMKEDGQNHAVRYSVLEDITNSNPEAVGRMGEKSREILERRLRHLKFQVDQLENAKIGRMGQKPALQE
jgi:hypothetical protein